MLFSAGPLLVLTIPQPVQRLDPHFGTAGIMPLPDFGTILVRRRIKSLGGLSGIL